MADWMPLSRTLAARSEKASCSSSARPNSFTRMAPATLKRSVICVLSLEFKFICSREISANRRPTRRAGAMKSGSTMRVRIVSRHSRKSMTGKVVASTMTLETTDPRVEVTAFWAPTTSLLRRLMRAPVWVRVKNATGIFWTLSKSATRSW